MSDKENPARAPRDQLRRQLLEQAAAAFDQMFATTGSGQSESRDQREQRAREFGLQLAAVLLQEECKSEAGFLQDIHAHPEDDTPRLIYADWLDDNHQPARAQFIRLQCRLAKLDLEDPDYDLLRLQAPPRHVVLSSCEVGRVSTRPGEEPLGVVTTLLHLGSRTVFAAVAPVTDGSTVEVMDAAVARPSSESYGIPLDIRYAPRLA